MNRRSLGASIFGLSSAIAVAVACGGKSAPPQQPLSNDTGDPAAGERGGALVEPNVPAGVADGALWTCQISEYDPQPCKFHRDGNEWKLTKLLGSQRFEGVVTFHEGGGFRFVGQFFCPWGACDEAMDVEFAQRDGYYDTSFGGDIISASWDESLASQWGGAGYGNLTGHEQ